jgi:uncharacterized protein (UPF0147 family)
VLRRLQRINKVAAGDIRHLLQEVADDTRSPEDLRERAAYYASVTDPRMRRSDLQAVVWLLREVSVHPRVPVDDRAAARFWAMPVSP